MLAKPGSGGGGGRLRATASNRRKTAESPDDAIRKLSKQAANKRCAECTTKSPTQVNLTFGTFVCLACSGIHREFNARVKGMGASSFTAEEVGRMTQPDAGNAAVNAA